MVNYILKLLAAMLLCLSAAADTTISIGVTHATLVPSGIWWQREFEHSLPKDVPSAGIRYDRKWSDAYSIGFGYTYVGAFQSHAKAIASDQAYDAWDKKGTPSYPVSDWYGDERVHALYGVARRTLGHWYYEAGPVVTYSQWKMHIPNWVGCRPDPPCLQPGYTQDLTVGRPKQVHLDLMAAVGYHINDKLSVRLAAYPTRIAGEFPGITKGYSPTLTLDYKF